jgi:hypothetical protein
LAIAQCGDVGSVKKTASRVHAEGLISFLKRVLQHFDAEQKAELSIAINAVSWEPVDLNSINLVLYDATAKETVARRARFPMQDYRAFTGYFTASEWKVMQAKGENALTHRSILDIITRKLLLADGRCLSEPSKKLAARFWLFLCGNQNPSIDSLKQAKASVSEEMEQGRG